MIKSSMTPTAHSGRTESVQHVPKDPISMSRASVKLPAIGARQSIPVMEPVWLASLPSSLRKKPVSRMRVLLLKTPIASLSSMVFAWAARKDFTLILKEPAPKWVIYAKATMGKMVIVWVVTLVSAYKNKMDVVSRMKNNSVISIVQNSTNKSAKNAQKVSSSMIITSVRWSTPSVKITTRTMESVQDALKGLNLSKVNVRSLMNRLHQMWTVLNGRIKFVWNVPIGPILIIKGNVLSWAKSVKLSTSKPGTVNHAMRAINWIRKKVNVIGISLFQPASNPIMENAKNVLSVTILLIKNPASPLTINVPSLITRKSSVKVAIQATVSSTKNAKLQKLTKN